MPQWQMLQGSKWHDSDSYHKAREPNNVVLLKYKGDFFIWS